MMKVPSPAQYEYRVQQRFQAEIEEMFASAAAAATEEYRGRLVRFNTHHHLADDGSFYLTEYTAPITEVVFEQPDGPDSVSLMMVFKLDVTNPTTGKVTTLSLRPYDVKFV
jgi:hypothetical protein